MIVSEELMLSTKTRQSSIDKKIDIRNNETEESLERTPLAYLRVLEQLDIHMQKKGQLKLYTKINLK